MYLRVKKMNLPDLGIQINLEMIEVHSQTQSLTLSWLKTVFQSSGLAQIVNQTRDVCNCYHLISHLSERISCSRTNHWYHF